ncbi:hypothetical protein CU478_10875 [Acinetobacter pseudolwoffii]|nr:hypothetical protein CU478_10875 [Acinetobacter pseudolwoffii]
MSDSNNTENFDPNESYLLNDYLTDEGFYELELNKDPQLGYKIGSLLKNTPTEKTYIPSSKIGHTGLQLTEKYELVDLSGKPLAEYIDTYTYLVSSEPKLNYYGSFGQLYLSKLKDKKFPSGSQCLRGISLSSTKDHILMYKHPLDSSDTFDPDNFSENYTTSTFGGYKTYISTKSYENDYTNAIAFINNKYRQGEYYKAGTSYTLNKEIELEQARLNKLKANNSGTPEEILEQELIIKAIKTECTVFNPTASKEIDKYRVM